ncbi:unnamed protein product [Brachionus calyciflorus]|uniref:Uncharacterized protein n=1 Tax=Brachionus calyciflorus TaxID=104777 RepID=A0A813SZQ8_9BILA|nr:unnamed protein product [Brachionus calyciflorus]
MSMKTNGEILENFIDRIVDIGVALKQALPVLTDSPNVASKLSDILKAANSNSKALTVITDKLENLERKIETLNVQLSAKNEQVEKLNQQVNALNGHVNTLSQASMVRIFNSYCLRPECLIQLIRIGSRKIPHDINTLYQFKNLNDEQITDFLEYYDLEKSEQNQENHLKLAIFLGINPSLI